MEHVYRIIKRLIQIAAGLLIFFIFLFNFQRLGKYFWLHLVLFFGFTYINIYIHEFGHAFAAKAVGIKISKIVIGTGKEIFKKIIWGFPLVITNNLKGGYTFPYGTEKGDVKRRFWVFSFGGILAQLLSAVAFSLLFGFNPSKFFTAAAIDIPNVFIISNLIGTALNLLPMNITYYGLKIPNDGLSLVKIPFMNKKDIRWLMSLGMINEAYYYFENKMFQSAEVLYRRCMEQFPDQELPKINLSATLIKLKMFEEASELLNNLEAQEHDNKYDFLILNNLAWIYLLKNDSDSLTKAMECAEKAYELNPNVSFICGTLGCVLIELGQMEEGINLLKKNVKLRKPPDEKTNNPMGFLFVAYGLYKKGERDKAKLYLDYLSRHYDKPDQEFDYLFEIIKKKTNCFDGYIRH